MRIDKWRYAVDWTKCQGVHAYIPAKVRGERVNRPGLVTWRK